MGYVRPESYGGVVRNDTEVNNYKDGIRSIMKSALITAKELEARDREQILSNNVQTNGELAIGAGRGTGDLVEFSIAYPLYQSSRAHNRRYHVPKLLGAQVDAPGRRVGTGGGWRLTSKIGVWFVCAGQNWDQQPFFSPNSSALPNI